MKVVLPFWQGDAWLLVKNLKWMIELDGKSQFDAILACDTATDRNEPMRLAKEFFRSVGLITYDRVKNNDWPFQQNNAFMNVAWAMYKQKDPWFWCETDCTPLKLKWLDTLWEEYRKGGKPFGGHWNPKTDIFNGVAVYPAKVTNFSPKMMKAALVLGKRDGKAAQPPWDAYGSLEAKKHLHIMNPVMQHIWDVDGICPTFPTQEDVDRLVRPEVVLFHRCKDGTLVDRMRERHKGWHSAIPVAPIVSFDDVHVRTEAPAISAPVVSTAPAPKSDPKVAIYIVTYYKDAEFLKYCLESIHRYALGFHSVVLAVPMADSAVISPIYQDFLARGMPIYRTYFKEEFREQGKGHLYQNLLKCHGDKRTTFDDKPVDFVLHVDSDCIFTAPFTPQDYMRDGKPILLYEDYERLKPVGTEGTGYLWKAPTENALGFAVQHEFMRRLPLMYPVALYGRMREHVERFKKTAFWGYVLKQKHTFPYGFAEFNTLGAYAWQYMHEQFCWVNAATDPLPANKLEQMWGRGGLDFKHEKYGVQRDFINSVLNKKPTENPNIILTDCGICVLKDDTHLSRWIEEHRRLDVAHEYLEQFRPLIPVGGTVIDAGTSLGDHTLTYAKMVGPTGRVLGFEANRDSAECCKLNMALYPWVSITNIGLHSESGRGTVKQNINAGASTVSSSGGSDLELAPLDSLFPDKGPQARCDFIKVDIEGSEPSFLDGAVRVLTKFRPPILMEVNDGQLAARGFTRKDIFSRLEALDYKWSVVDGKEHDLQFDILATPK